MLLGAGVGSRWLRRRLAAGQWHQPFPGVVDAGGVATTIRGRIRAALLYAGDDGVVSHGTAAALLGLTPMPLPTEVLHVSVPHGRRRRPTPGLVVHQRRVQRAVLELAGLPVTGPMGTIVDIAGTLPRNDLRCLVADGLRKRLISMTDMRTVDGVPRDAMRSMGLIEEEFAAGAQSGPEAAYWRAVKEAQLPLPELNAAIQTDDGTRYLDGLWRRWRLGVEIDGRSVHAKAEAFERDHRRQNLVQREGIVLMLFTGNQVFADPGWVAAETAVGLTRRAAELGLDLPGDRCG